jgi:hypothetical protein
VRRAGAGRPRAEELDPSVGPALKALVDPGTRGDPESPLRWTAKSARNLSDALVRAGHVISPDTVERLLKEDGYSLQGNAKTVEGKQHPDRDGQFRHISALVTAFQAAGDPVISVDTKKKELTRKLEISWARGSGPWPSGLVRVCERGMGQAAWLFPGPPGSGSGMRQRVTSKPRAPSLPTWWAICRRTLAWRS